MKIRKKTNAKTPLDDITIYSKCQHTVLHVGMTALNNADVYLYLFQN